MTNSSGGTANEMELRANTNIAAALAILEDGKPRNAAALLRDGVANGSFPPSTTEASIYAGLTEYIARETMRGRKSETSKIRRRSRSG